MDLSPALLKILRWPSVSVISCFIFTTPSFVQVELSSSTSSWLNSKFSGTGLENFFLGPEFEVVDSRFLLTLFCSPFKFRWIVFSRFWMSPHRLTSSNKMSCRLKMLLYWEFLKILDTRAHLNNSRNLHSPDPLLTWNISMKAVA